MDSLIAAVGRDGAVALALQLGGSQVHIPAPQNLREDHPVVQAMNGSIEDARKVCKALSGETVYIPMARRCIVQHLRASHGLTNREIASRLSISIKTVRRYIREGSQ